MDRRQAKAVYPIMCFGMNNDAGHPALDAIVKASGKWEEASQLDTTSLVRIVEGGLWSKYLIDQVMKYGRIEPTEAVSISKLKE